MHYLRTLGARTQYLAHTHTWMCRLAKKLTHIRCKHQPHANKASSHTKVQNLLACNQVPMMFGSSRLPTKTTTSTMLALPKKMRCPIWNKMKQSCQGVRKCLMDYFPIHWAWRHSPMLSAQHTNVLNEGYRVWTMRFFECRQYRSHRINVVARRIFDCGQNTIEQFVSFRPNTQWAVHHTNTPGLCIFLYTCTRHHRGKAPREFCLRWIDGGNPLSYLILSFGKSWAWGTQSKQETQKKEVLLASKTYLRYMRSAYEVAHLIVDKFFHGRVRTQFSLADFHCTEGSTRKYAPMQNR